jgi:hypothetical protein
MPSLLSLLRHTMPSVFAGSSAGHSTGDRYNKNNSYKLGGTSATGGGDSVVGYHASAGRRSAPLFVPTGPGIQKSVTHTVSYMPRRASKEGEEDVVELMGKGDVEKAATVGSSYSKRGDSEGDGEVEGGFPRW